MTTARPVAKSTLALAAPGTLDSTRFIVLAQPLHVIPKSRQNRGFAATVPRFMLIHRSLFFTVNWKPNVYFTGHKNEGNHSSELETIWVCQLLEGQAPEANEFLRAT
jgi:hypothetical protein